MTIRPGDLVAVPLKPGTPDHGAWGPGPWIARVTSVDGDTVHLMRHVGEPKPSPIHAVAHASEVAPLDEQHIARTALTAEQHRRDLQADALILERVRQRPAQGTAAAWDAVSFLDDARPYREYAG